MFTAALLPPFMYRADVCVEYLLRCGIQVWVLTGDKKETAENIGYSTRLLQAGTRQLPVCVGLV